MFESIYIQVESDFRNLYCSMGLVLSNPSIEDWLASKTRINQTSSRDFSGSAIQVLVLKLCGYDFRFENMDCTSDNFQISLFENDPKEFKPKLEIFTTPHLFEDGSVFF